ncbi:MAG TPA: 3-carboxy-cis,cis-muconate cycloisomerase [Streptosporangiaceae bacterium]|nr:3-carboxy-cis,cis-muconate cycloisomerase [Streptosporangiaceae bacterium]
MGNSERDGLFSRLFDRGAAATGDDAWLQAMLDAEAALARALERAGQAPAGAGAAVTAAARASLFDAGQIGRQAALTGNPVPALVRALTALVPDFAASAVHRGATSQDIIDTAAMLMARRVIESAGTDLAAAAAAAAALAREHAGTVMAGRTLLQQAVPVTFGLVAAGWLTAIDEARRRLDAIRRDRLAVQFGGAAGTLASLGDAGPAVAARFAAELGLARPVLPWHTDRLRVIELAAALAGVCAVLGKIARDVTLLAQSEVGEVSEGDAPGGGGSPGGSSAMPHKRNPVAAVVILGCTRRAPSLLAGLVAAAEQEQQRAAGAWHAEWEPLADLLRLTGSAAAWSAQLLAGLRVDAGRMRANLDGARGLPLAEHVTAILAPAMGRLEAHDLVAAASALAGDSGRMLGDVLLGTPQFADPIAAAGITPGQVAGALEPEGYLGAAGAFVSAALTAHQEQESRREER